MIPLTLHLKNFLSYGATPQVIEFGPYPLICLSGHNGHGKSALLDAMTWALWGQARKISGAVKADMQLMHLGQSQMLIIFDFICNGQTYRVRRECTKSETKITTHLDFGLLNCQTQMVVPLSEKTVRDTQDKIERVLTLSFESFVNSAFLRQGHSNEFSKKTPKERKEVLAAILGLHQYENIRRRAMDKAKEATMRKTALVTIQENIQLELNNAPALVERIAAVNQHIATLESTSAMLATQQATIAQARTQLVEDQKRHHLITFKIQSLHDDMQSLHERLRTVRGTWRSVHRQLLTLPSTTALEHERATLLRTISEQQELLQKSLELKQALLTTQQALHVLEKKLDEEASKELQGRQLDIERLILEKKNLEVYRAEQRAHQQRALELTQKQAQELSALKTRIATIEALTELIGLQEKIFEKRHEYYQKFIAQGNWIKKEIDALDQKKKLAHADDNPSCPLCEQNLSASRKRFLRTTFEKQEQFLVHRFSRLSTLIMQLKAVLVEQHATLVGFKKQLQEAVTLQATHDALQKTHEATVAQNNQYITAIEEAEKKYTFVCTALTTAQATLQEYTSTVRATIHTNPEYRALTATRSAQESALAAITYNPQQHTQLQQRLATVQEGLQNISQIQQQAALQAERMHEITTLCTTLRAVKKQIPVHEQEKVKCNVSAQREHALKQQEASLAQAQEVLAREKEAIHQERGTVLAQQENLALRQKEYHAHTQTIATLTETIDDYQAIAVATSKDGLQALLIEEALPEIEHEANQLLAKLTNNQAHITIESLRDLQKGGAKETLDINISDGVGIRPYELFSGGEAFRIDFSLRIAISKLLARRAGTSLQTLIIDEGFGSQDEEGLSHIMDVIHKIQDDFAKIIIVSHLPAMKEQFPVHFHIEKRPQGSVVTVLEQG